MGPNQFRFSVALAVGGLLLGLAFLTLPGQVAWAQEFTATPWSTPTAPDFGVDPVYEDPPTLIPTISYPDVSDLPQPPATGTPATPQSISTPSLPVVTLPDTPVPTLSPINASIGVQVATPAPITGGDTISMTQVYTDITNVLLSTESSISGVISYSGYLSSTFFEVTLNPDMLSESSAPEWYATPLPQEVKDVGWQFEQMSQDLRKRYSVASWGVWVIRVFTLPVKMIKGLRWITEIFSPLGLFIGWLLIMLPIVAVFRIMKWLKNAFISIFNFVFELIKFLISFIPGIG